MNKEIQDWLYKNSHNVDSGSQMNIKIPMINTFQIEGELIPLVRQQEQERIMAMIFIMGNLPRDVPFKIQEALRITNAELERRSNNE